MTISPEHLSGTNSFFARRDPRWRLLAFFISVMLVSVLRERWPSVVAFVVAVGVLLLGRVPVAWYRPRLLLVAFGLIPFALVVPFTVARGEVLWDWQFLQLTDEGLVVTVVIVLKTFTITLLMLTLIASGPFHVMMEAAGMIGAPPRVVHITLLTYRYVFVLLEELNRLRVALRVRAFRNAMNTHSFRTIGQVTGTLLVRGSDRAEYVAHAMRCRGFDGFFRSMHVFRATAADRLMFVVLVGIMTSLLVWDLFG